MRKTGVKINSLPAVSAPLPLLSSFPPPFFLSMSVTPLSPLSSVCVLAFHTPLYALVSVPPASSTILSFFIHNLAVLVRASSSLPAMLSLPVWIPRAHLSALCASMPLVLSLPAALVRLCGFSSLQSLGWSRSSSSSPTYYCRMEQRPFV